MDASLLLPRDVPLGGPRAMTVRRTLPHRDRRTIGPWCFVDHYGPHHRDPSSVRPLMDVPPHPHTGLQTVSWLLDGEVLHRDSVGNVATIRPGELNLMTAGHGIAHSEESIVSAGTSPATALHGVQLWVALPDTARHQQAHFEHHADLPHVPNDAATVTVFLGALAGTVSPAATYSPILGAEVRLQPGGSVELSLDIDFEHGVLAVQGEVTVDGDPVPHAALRHQPPGRRSMILHSEHGATALLLGGPPFDEPLLMWWNFVGRTHDEIAEARNDWEKDVRFGHVHGYDGGPLPAPALPPVRLRPHAPATLDLVTGPAAPTPMS
ncbi:MAG: pirin family protein [Actinomycetales bacterium]